VNPEQAHRLQDLFLEARKTGRTAYAMTFTAENMNQARAADEAAVEAFMNAVDEMTTETWVPQVYDCHCTEPCEHWREQ